MRLLLRAVVAVVLAEYLTLVLGIPLGWDPHLLSGFSLACASAATLLAGVALVLGLPGRPR